MLSFFTEEMNSKLFLKESSIMRNTVRYLLKIVNLKLQLKYRVTSWADLQNADPRKRRLKLYMLKLTDPNSSIEQKNFYFYYSTN